MEEREELAPAGRIRMLGLESPIHWIVILGVVFLLFGHRLPSVMRSLGQGVVEFKKGLQGIEDETKKAPVGKIEEQAPKPQLKGEPKAEEAEVAQK
jgi:sec-independent protein translocase protein TatA